MIKAKSVFELAEEMNVSCNLGDLNLGELMEEDRVGRGVAMNLINMNDMPIVFPNNKDVVIPSHIAKQIGKKKLGIGILNTSHGAVYRAMTTTKPRDTVTMIENSVKAVDRDYSSAIIRDETIHANLIDTMIDLEDIHLKAYNAIGMGVSMYSYQQMMIDSMSTLSIPEKEILSPRERKARYRQGLKSINGKKKKHYE